MAGVDELNNEIGKRKKENVINGFLDLRSCKITKLPNNLTVRGNLFLSNNTGITALPDNLTVDGSLYISGTAIATLPDNLTVHGSINLSGTGITALPDKLRVGGEVHGLEENQQRVNGEKAENNGRVETQILMRQCMEEVKEEWEVFYNICLQEKSKNPLLRDQPVPVASLVDKFAVEVREFVRRKYPLILSRPESLFWGLVFAAISESKTCSQDDVRAVLKEIAKRCMAASTSAAPGSRRCPTNSVQE